MTACTRNSMKFCVCSVEHLVKFEHMVTPVFFVFYRSPDAGKIKLKMLYASSKDALLKKIKGLVTKPVQANDASDMTYEEVIGKA